MWTIDPKTAERRAISCSWKPRRSNPVETTSTREREINSSTSSTSSSAPRSARGGMILPSGWKSARSRSKSGWLPGGNETDSYIARMSASVVATSGGATEGELLLPRRGVDCLAMNGFLRVMRDFLTGVTEYTPNGVGLQFDFERRVEYVHAPQPRPQTQ